MVAAPPASVALPMTVPPWLSVTVPVAEAGATLIATEPALP